MNKTFLFFKIESWNFQHLSEKEFRETSQNFNLFGLFRQFLFSIQVSDKVEILRGFTKYFLKQMVKISAFYLEKQKSFISKKMWSIGQDSSSRWCLLSQFSVKILVHKSMRIGSTINFCLFIICQVCKVKHWVPNWPWFLFVNLKVISENVICINQMEHYAYHIKVS